MPGAGLPGVNVTVPSGRGKRAPACRAQAPLPTRAALPLSFYFSPIPF